MSDKCSKSVTVQVQHYKYVSKYNASVQVRKKIMAHDEEEVRLSASCLREYACIFVFICNMCYICEQ